MQFCVYGRATCPRLALRDGRDFDGRPSLQGHCGSDWTRSVLAWFAIDARQSHDGSIKRSMHRSGLGAIIISSRLPALIQIAAPFSSSLSRYNDVGCANTTGKDTMPPNPGLFWLDLIATKGCDHANSAWNSGRVGPVSANQPAAAAYEYPGARTRAVSTYCGAYPALRK